MGEIRPSQDEKSLFQELTIRIVKEELNAKLIDEVYSLIYDQETFKRLRLNYPQIKYNIDPLNEIDEINNVLDVLRNNPLWNKISIVDNTDAHTSEPKIILKTSLEKLFFTLIWKNGLLNRFSSIIDGIKDPNNTTNKSDDDGSETEYLEPNNGIVFTQFGRYLSNKKQPIIDQHVLRYYYLIKMLKSQKLETGPGFLETIKKFEGPNKYSKLNNKGKFKPLIEYGNPANQIKVDHKNQYLKYLNSLTNISEETRYKIDCINFTFGKLYKNL